MDITETEAQKLEMLISDCFGTEPLAQTEDVIKLVNTILQAHEAKIKAEMGLAMDRYGENCKKDERKRFIEKINNIVNEFGDNPKECLGIIEEYLNGKEEIIF